MTLLRSTRNIVFFFAFFACFCPLITTAQQIESYFSPRGGCAVAIASELRKATTSIDVVAYQLSHSGLAAELIAAHARGVAVRVIVDAKQDSPKVPATSRLSAAFVPIRVDAFEKLQHNKYAILDGKTVITGSYNWSDNAENRNAENVVIIRDIPTAAAFAADFRKHWQHSRGPFNGPEPSSTHSPTRAFSSPLNHRLRTKESPQWHE